MATTKPVDPAAVAHAVKAVKAGASLREVQAELAELDVHVSHETIRAWARRAAQKAAAKPRAYAAADVFTMVVQGTREHATRLADLLEPEELDRAAIEGAWGELREAMGSLLRADDGT